MSDRRELSIFSIVPVPFREERPKLQLLEQDQDSMQGSDVNGRGATASQKGKLQSLGLEFFRWRRWLDEMHVKMNRLYANGKKEYLQVLGEVVQFFIRRGFTLVLRGDTEANSLYYSTGSVITRGVFKPPVYDPDEKKRPGSIMLIEQWRDTAVEIIRLFFATKVFLDIFITTSVAGSRSSVTQENLTAIWGDPALPEIEKVKLSTSLLTPLFSYNSLLPQGDERKSNVDEVWAQLSNFLDEQQMGLSQIVAERVAEWIRNYNGRVNSKK